ncbi:Phosphoenolpyruvate carboxylase [Gossypium arboreum]|uniref:Phosphoenolpyruvate carboxylase n=1 Tax=Gossypium arboreum TaxID=29729 RepID=A0A0B0PFG9_GOSAR|nr:Phosphoenolpyruvate carboxylase [Gossypium arboreum]
MGWPPRVRRKRTMVAKGASFSILLETLAGSYGSVIECFQRREGLKEMIKGVIFNSRSADPLNPKWYRSVESEHFPNSSGLRARMEQWTFGLYLACIKYLMSAFDVLEFDEAFSSFRITSYKSFTRLHINHDGYLEVFTLAVDKVPRE